MPSESAPRRVPLWGLWAIFTAAAIGFAVFLSGLLRDAVVPMLGGAAFMILSTFGYLLLHFWAQAVQAMSPAAEAPRREPVRAELAHRPPAAPRTPPLEHVARRASHHAGESREAPPAIEAAAPFEETLVARRPAGSPEGALGQLLVEQGKPIEFEHAMRRRDRMVADLPILRTVFGAERPERTVDHPARPGKTRGRCSGCDTILWAPTIRPVRLRCPSCGRTKWLKE